MKEIIAYAEGKVELTDFESVLKFFDTLSLNLPWHPDTPFNDYVYPADSSRIFTDDQAKALDAVLEKSRSICESHDPVSFAREDIYALGLRSIRRALTGQIHRPGMEPILKLDKSIKH